MNGDILHIDNGQQVWGIPNSIVSKSSQAQFSQALDAHTETGLLEPLGANLNLSEIPEDEQLGALQLRVNDLERFVNVQSGVINTLIDVLQAAGLAD